MRKKWGLADPPEMVYISSPPPFYEVEIEEKNEKGRVVGTTYKMVQEEGPRRVTRRHALPLPCDRLRGAARGTPWTRAL